MSFLNRSNGFYLVGIAILAFAFWGCNSDDEATDLNPTSDNVEVQDFMWQAMNEWYFWQTDVPNLADDRFANNAEYTEFLESESDPETFLRSLLFTEDRFTFWNEDYEVLINSLSGVTKSNGLQFFIVDLDADTTDNLFGFIRNVVPGSSAAAAGLQRGDVFYAVDGQVLSADNYRALLIDGNDTYTLQMGELDVPNRLVVPTDETVTLTKVEDFQENPIRLATTLTIGEHKIGYLMYRQFNRNFNAELNNAFGEFVAEGVTDLVLDMRYNGGGSVNTSRLLASMIYGANTNELYIRQQWNDKKQASFSSSQLEDYFANNVDGAFLNSLNLNRVYVLGTQRTASASELVMNGLDPYIEVIHIGTTTRGKNEFSISLVDDPEGVFGPYTYGSGQRTNHINPDNRWIIQPLVGRNANAAGFIDYTAGFAPDIELEEDIFNLGTFGSPDEPLLARAIQEITGSTARTQLPLVVERDYLEYELPERDMMLLDKPLEIH